MRWRTCQASSRAPVNRSTAMPCDERPCSNDGANRETNCSSGSPNVMAPMFPARLNVDRALSNGAPNPESLQNGSLIAPHVLSVGEWTMLRKLYTTKSNQLGRG